MKRALLFFIFLALLIVPQIADAAKRIPSSKAAFHVGEDVMVCGKIANVSPITRRTMINIGRPYPSEDIGLLIWNTDMPAFIQRFGDLKSLEGHQICAVGIVEIYNNHLQLKVSNPTMLRLMKK